MSCPVSHKARSCPILFLLFINDMPSTIDLTCKLALYATTAKLYCTINNIHDCITLQEQLTRLAVTLNKWKLRFNADKTVRQCISLGRYYRLYTATNWMVQSLKGSRSSRTIQSNLHWDEQIGTLRIKCYTTSRWPSAYTSQWRQKSCCIFPWSDPTLNLVQLIGHPSPNSTLSYWSQFKARPPNSY